MDEHSKKISVKVNGRETGYKEERATTNIISLQKHRKEKNKKQLMKMPSSMKNVFNNKSRNQIIVIVVCAVIVGTGLGYGMLGIMSQFSTKAPVTLDSTPVSASIVTLVLPELPVKALQLGVFSKVEGAQAFKDQWKGKDYPLGVMALDKVYVIGGVSVDEKGLDSVAQLYKAQDIPFYKKAYSIPEAKVDVMGTIKAKIVQNARILCGEILTISSKVKNGEMPVQGEWDKLQKVYGETYTQNAGDVKEIQEFLQATKTSYEGLQAYKKDTNEGTYIKLQQPLINMVGSYQAFTKENGKK